MVYLFFGCHDMPGLWRDCMVCVIEQRKGFKSCFFFIIYCNGDPFLDCGVAIKAVLLFLFIFRLYFRLICVFICVFVVLCSLVWVCEAVFVGY